MVITEWYQVKVSVQVCISIFGENRWQWEDRQD